MFSLPADAGGQPPRDLLLDHAKAGSRDAFESLVERYGAQVKRAAYRLTGDPDDARDVAQHVLTQLYLNLERFEDGGSLNAWINTVTLHRCQDIRRARSLQSNRGRALEPDTGGTRPDEVALRRDLSRQVRALIAGLPDEYRSVLEMRHFGALPFDEIARELALPAKRVKSLAWRAERRLRAELLQRGLDREL